MNYTGYVDSSIWHFLSIKSNICIWQAALMSVPECHTVWVRSNKLIEVKNCRTKRTPSFIEIISYIQGRASCSRHRQSESTRRHLNGHFSLNWCFYGRQQFYISVGIISNISDVPTVLSDTLPVKSLDTHSLYHLFHEKTHVFSCVTVIAKWFYYDQFSSSFNEPPLANIMCYLKMIIYVNISLKHSFYYKILC